MNKGTQGFPSGRGLELRSLGDVQQGAVRTGAEANGLTPSWDAGSQQFRLARGPLFDPMRSLYNARPEFLFNWRAAIGNTRQAISDTYIVWIGDSTSVATGITGGALKSPVTQFAQMCTSRGFVPNAGYEHFVGAQGVSSPVYSLWDTRVVLGSGVTGSGIDSAYQFHAGDGDTTITPTVAWDTVRVWSLVSAANFGTITVKQGAATLGTTTLRTTGTTVASDTFTTGAAAAVQSLTLT